MGLYPVYILSETPEDWSPIPGMTSSPPIDIYGFQPTQEK